MDVCNNLVGVGRVSIFQDAIIKGLHFRHHHFHKLLHRTETSCWRRTELSKQKGRAHLSWLHRVQKSLCFFIQEPRSRNKNKNKLVGRRNYQNRLVECPETSSWLLPRTLNFLRQSNDLGAISISNKDSFLIAKLNKSNKNIQNSQTSQKNSMLFDLSNLYDVSLKNPIWSHSRTKWD